MKTRFEKVSRVQFERDWEDLFGTKPNDEIYDNIKIPSRATKKSAGYDFFAPFTFMLGPGETVTIPTGIRAIMADDQCLLLIPRSGLGFKYRLQLDNTIGCVDADFSESENEGHIRAKITNDSKEYRTCIVDIGKAFMQGVIVRYCQMDEEETPEKDRNGGFGSTGV